MSNPNEEHKEIITNEEESTIFSAPTHEDEKVKKTGMLKRILACFLVFAVIAGSALAIKLIIPEKNETTENKDEITLTVGKSKDFPTVEFINKETDTTIVFKALEGEEYDSINARDWYIVGVDEDKIDYTKTAKAINALGGLKAMGQISDTVDDVLYGFDNPKYIINFLAPENAQVPSYTAKIGKLSPDNSGRYVTLSNRKGVYLVRNSHFDSFDMNVLDFAKVSNMGKISAGESVSNTYYSNGKLTKADKIELYTKEIRKTYTFKMAEDTKLYGYDITSPENRPCADAAVQVLIDFFADGVTGDGAYSYEATKAELIKLGLDNPDIRLTISVEGVKRTIKATLQSDGKYALVVDDEGIIGKIEPSAITFKDMGITDYYNELMLFQSINTIKTMSVKTEKEKYDFSFSSKYDAESKTDALEKVFYNDKELDLIKFQNYYLELISLTAVEHNYVDTNGKAADTTVYLTYNNDEVDTEMNFYKVSDNRYQVEINSTPMGLISLTSYNDFIAATSEIVK